MHFHLRPSMLWVCQGPKGSEQKARGAKNASANAGASVGEGEDAVARADGSAVSA